MKIYSSSRYVYKRTKRRLRGKHSGSARKVQLHRRIAKKLNAESWSYIYKGHQLQGIKFKTPEKEIYFIAIKKEV